MWTAKVSLPDRAQNSPPTGEVSGKNMAWLSRNKSLNAKRPEKFANGILGN